MSILDDISKMKQTDRSDVYESICSFPQQCRHAYSEVSQNSQFKRIEGVKNIVMSGMGGSGLAARVIKPLYKNKLKVPVDLINSYSLPGFTGKDTLVIVSSYSGNTEETLNTFQEAFDKGARIMAICAGGRLYSLCQKHNIPVYKIDPVYNPCGQPRMAVGYSIFGQLAMLAKAGFIEVDGKDVESLVDYLENEQKEYIREVPLASNKAKQIAGEFFQRIPVLIGAEHISGALHVTKNQINENAKTFALLFLMPELNHHLMEGLRFPEADKKVLKFLFYNSGLYSERIRRRFALTEDVVSKNGIGTVTQKLQAGSEFLQVFEAVQFGSFWQYYLTMLYGIDPAPIPWVDYFKAKLGSGGKD